jgi:hypothetical protein
MPQGSSREYELSNLEETWPVTLSREGYRAVSLARDALCLDEPAENWDTPIVGYEIYEKDAPDERGTFRHRLGARVLAFAEWSAQIRDKDGRTIAYGYSGWSGMSAVPASSPDPRA